MSTPPIVIIAEPDPIISSVLRVEFTHWDFAVLLAASGREAEDYAAHTVAHLIVLDARTATGCLRRLRPHPPAAGICHSADRADHEQAVAQGQGGGRRGRRHGRAGETVFGQRPFQCDTAISSRPTTCCLPSRPGSGMNPPKEWAPASVQTWQPGGNPALARNGQLLPVVRGQGVTLPFIRKP